jgi:hypothetical protein
MYPGPSSRKHRSRSLLILHVIGWGGGATGVLIREAFVRKDVLSGRTFRLRDRREFEDLIGALTGGSSSVLLVFCLAAVSILASFTSRSIHRRTIPANIIPASAVASASDRAKIATTIGRAGSKKNDL